MLEILPQPPYTIMSESVAYLVSADIHPQTDPERVDNIDFEARLRQRAAQLDPESQTIHTRSDGVALTESDLHEILSRVVSITRRSTNFQVGERTLYYQLEEMCVYEADTDERLKQMHIEEYGYQQHLASARALLAAEPCRLNE